MGDFNSILDSNKKRICVVKDKSEKTTEVWKGKNTENTKRQ